MFSNASDNVALLKAKMASIILIIVGLVLTVNNSLATQWSGLVASEYRYFQHQSPYSYSNQHGFAVVLAPEFYHEWNGGQQSLLIAPFLRIDSAYERTHADLREALWLIVADDWELRLGVGKVYWGVAEAQHLVDVINQTDLIENTDAEDKLGQPMLNFSWLQGWGTVDLFVLPYFRERTFSRLVVDTAKAKYESSIKQWHVDVALRLSHTIGNLDVGLAHFYGTNREPLLKKPKENSKPYPLYKIMQQTSVDIQLTMQSWLWKLEVIGRETSPDAFVALTGGFEYTFYGVFNTNADVGVIGEYLFDGRGKETQFANDILIGIRLACNDAQSTELLLGVIQDLSSSDGLWNIEASRRIGDRWKLSLEGRFVMLATPNNALFKATSKDNYLQLKLARYF